MDAVDKEHARDRGQICGEPAGGPSVDELISRWLAQEKLDAAPGLVSLRLVHRGPDKLTKVPAERDAAEAAATVLDPEDTLGEAGVADGAWLVAVFANSVQHGAASSSVLSAAETHAALSTATAQLASLAARLTAHTIHDTTPAALGDKTLAALRVGSRVEDFAGGDGDAVLDAEQQRALLLCRSEAEVIKFLTPVLWRLRVTDDAADPCRSVLLNSENLAWLDNLASPLRGMRLKPDLFEIGRAHV